MSTDLDANVSLLNQGSVEKQALNLLSDILIGESLGRCAVVSSFGAESAVLLHLVSRVDPDAPVIFVDTRMLFRETLVYQLSLSENLGLSNVIRVRPSAEAVQHRDSDGALNRTDPDACCHLRKVEPLEQYLDGYDAWISGRKSHQSVARNSLQAFEAEHASGRIKVNPLAFWSRDDVTGYFQKYDLPGHPLVKEGFLSIGCEPCTSKVKHGEDPRSGRWRGLAKTECGIHDRVPTANGAVR